MQMAPNTNTRRLGASVMYEAEGMHGHQPALTRSAHAAQVYALAEAQFSGLDEPGTEHLLAALLHDEHSLAVRILARCGIRRQLALRALTDSAGLEGPPATVLVVDTPDQGSVGEISSRSTTHTLAIDMTVQTDSAAIATDLAIADAAAHGSQWVTTGHLLLGVLLADATTGSLVLQGLGLSATLVRQLLRIAGEES